MNQLCNQINILHCEARQKYEKALSQLRTEKCSLWFQHFLDETVIPQLQQIGFTPELIQALFEIAAPSWQKMGKGVYSCHWINPKLTQSLETIREGVINSAAKAKYQKTCMKNIPPQELHTHIQRANKPENLLSILDDIYSSWIILPRAFPLLEEKEGCCLISYLNYLNKEDTPEFKRILSRIITEFIANYSLKFASTNQPIQAVIKTIFYGYLTMFYVNSMSPSQEYKVMNLHCNFMIWLETFQKRTNVIVDTPLKTAREIMIKYQTQQDDDLKSVSLGK